MNAAALIELRQSALAWTARRGTAAEAARSRSATIREMTGPTCHHIADAVGAQGHLKRNKALAVANAQGAPLRAIGECLEGRRHPCPGRGLDVASRGRPARAAYRSRSRAGAGVAASLMSVATAVRRKRKPVPATVHPAGSPEAVADVRHFAVQEQRRRARREEERELERRSSKRERKRLL